MSLLPLSGAFEGGSNGVLVTAANSGGASGNVFDTVSATGWTYTTTQKAHGSLAATATNPTNQIMTWTGFGSLLSTVYVRIYVYVTALPTGAHYNIVKLLTAASGAVAYMTLGTDGKFYCPNAVGSFGTGLPAAGSYSTGQWIRLEMAVTPDASAGVITHRLYNTADSDTATGSNTRSATNTGANIDKIQVGEVAGGAPVVTVYIDDIAIGQTNYFGPFANNFNNLVAPTVTGGLTVGGTLTANSGTWAPTPSSFGYYWHRADDAAGTNLVEIGATGSTYTLASADANKYIRAGVIPVA